MRNMVQGTLKICYWNVEGLKLSDCCPKLEDEDFLNMVKCHDLIFLAETHCDKDQTIMIDGYSSFKICRPKDKKINRNFGGLAFLYKSELQDGIDIIKQCTDFLWVKLHKNFFNTERDTFICSAYIPPENSSFYKK